MRKKAWLVLVLIGFLVLSTFLLVFDWPSPDSEWEYYIEPCIFTASEEVNVGGITYSLETYMYRDFMPISPPDGRPLIVIIRVHALGVNDFPLSTIIERLWLIDGSNIISTLPTEKYSVDGNTFRMAFLNGPKWGPDIFVDVIVKLIDMDFSFCVKAVDQPIHRIS